MIQNFIPADFRKKEWLDNVFGSRTLVLLAGFIAFLFQETRKDSEAAPFSLTGR